MKCNQDLFETLFQTAQKPLVMECSQALEAIRFSLPIDWTVQQQSESLLYLLPSEGESSLSVQSVIPESTDITDFESVSVLYAFADGMREQLENYAYAELCDYEGVFDAEQPIYGNDNRYPSVSCGTSDLLLEFFRCFADRTVSLCKIISGKSDDFRII